MTDVACFAARTSGVPEVRLLDRLGKWRRGPRIPLDTNLNARHYRSMSRRRFGQGVVLAIILLSTIVLVLGLAQSASVGDKLCAPTLTELKLPMNFPRWFGCALAMHENLAGGLIGGAGALFAAWLAWQAIMRQINAQADQAYEALQVELEPVVDTLNLYWRVVDASIKNSKWRENGSALLRSMHPSPSRLSEAISEDLANRLDPVRHRQFKKLMESLSWIAQRMDRTHTSEPLWFENVRTMLSHFNVFLREFDPVAAKKFRRRKKSRVDHRSMAQYSETLIKKFERTGNL
jgi:hypothetical protein